MRLYNISHPKAGAILKQGDTFTIVIPPIGEYIEFDEKHLPKIHVLIEKTFKKLSLTPPAGIKEVQQKNEAIVDLQEQVRLLQAQLEAMKSLQQENAKEEPVAKEEVEEEEEQQEEKEIKGRGRPPKKDN